MTVYNQIIHSNTAFAVLVDPDKLPLHQFRQFGQLMSAAKVDIILVGGSTLFLPDFSSWLQKLKSELHCPVVCFPGSGFQIHPEFDATLFLSLVSSRNSDYLIGKQVEAAPLLSAWKQETISTAYTLIGTEISSTAYITQSTPIPPSKVELVMATCLAAELFGFQMHYLEGGSGSQNSISPELVSQIRPKLSKPIMLGGGIQTPAQASELADAGVNIIVIGTQIEHNMESVLDFAEAIHA